MAISSPSPALARLAAGRLAPLLAGVANEAERADRSRRLVRLLVHQAAALRHATLRDWPGPAPGDDALLVVARDIAAMHAELPVEWIGSVHEQALGEHASAGSGPRRSGSRRKRTGAFYTPPDLVAHLLDHALEPVIDERLRRHGDPVAAIASIRLLDPSCGGGNFLLAAARRLAARLVRHATWSMPEAMSLVVTSCIHGVDRDSAAVEACIGALMLEAACPALSRNAVAANILHGDALTGTLASTDLTVSPRASRPRRVAGVAAADPAASSPTRPDRDAWCRAFLRRHADEQSDTDLPFLHWAEAFPSVLARDDADAGFDVVVGNPPFLNQLEKATALALDRLEVIWTIIPAIVMTFLVVSGLDAWNTVMADLTDEEDYLEIEATGFQFGWNIRYPGADGLLGEKNFKLISGTNPLGQNWKDEKNLDDFHPGEIVLPKGKKIRVRITAQDVLHNFYLPHFRVKMDAVPGMPTYFVFTPMKTTDEYRQELSNYPEYNVPADPKDPETKMLWEVFDYELACAELCGRGHYSMRRLVRIVEQDEYDAWQAQQQSYYFSNVRGKEDDPWKGRIFEGEQQPAATDTTATESTSMR